MDNYILLIDNPNKDVLALVKEIKPECEDSYVIHSSGGIETLTLVINICNLVICFAQYPLLIQYIVDKKITVKFGGFILHGTPKHIIKKVSESPELIKEIKKAYKKKHIEQDGDVGKIVEFERELKNLLDKYK